MGRAWHGRAVARGRGASGRAESCKCTVLRVGRIAPIAREHSYVIIVRHICYSSIVESASRKICVGFCSKFATQSTQVPYYCFNKGDQTDTLQLPNKT